jgi:hypothetical protein
MTEVKQHRDVPSGVRVDQRNSGGIRTTPAGGEVSREQYYQPSPPPLTVDQTTQDPARQINRPLIHRQDY